MTPTNPITEAREAALDLWRRAQAVTCEIPKRQFIEGRYNSVTAALDLVETQAAEIERLSELITDQHEEIGRLLNKGSEERDSQALLEECREALKPFADAAKAFAPSISNDDWVPIDFVCGKDMAEITAPVHGFRTAASLIEKLEGMG